MSTNSVRAALALLAAGAFAAPAPASPGAGSIAGTDGSAIYEVSPERGGTVITKVRGSDRTAVATRRLRGSFELPAVAGVAGGLSHDGRTLVVAGHPRAAMTQFALLDTRALRVRRTLSLRGEYSFDALSPDASTLYVIRFLSSDGTHYAVQALDLTHPRPTAQTVVEKGEPGEAMTGLPLGRATSPDGGWVYTLYDGAGKAPFVHALSTVDGFTVCIDLDALAGTSTAALDLKLRPNARKLQVQDRGTPVAVIQTDTFDVTNPPPPTKRTIQPAAPKANESTGMPWWLVVVAIGGMGAALGATTRRAHAGPDPTET